MLELNSIANIFILPAFPPSPRGTFKINCPISQKFGTNGPYVYRNRLAFLKFSSPPGVHAPPQGDFFYLIYRFHWNLVQIVLMYVGID